MSNFVDKAQIHVKAGNGGAGCVSFRREPYVPKGGPDGGNGGHGGDVYLQASYNVSSLSAFVDQPFRRAQDGGHGSSGKKHGKRGKDLVIEVPVGTVVKDLEGNLVAELLAESSRVLVASGGRGGRGNAYLITTSNKVPTIAEQGELGEDLWFNLELKLIADVGIVGLPNAGKSTLISSITNKSAKVAPYPFTTLVPNLGVVYNSEQDSIILADIPGIIEGAAAGKGLGLEFLRHIERVSALLFLIDLANTEINPARQLDILKNELAKYGKDLVNKPKIVVGNKADLLDADKLNDNLARVDLVISALTGCNTELLKEKLVELVKMSKSQERVAETVVHRPVARGIKVEKKDGKYYVLGRDAIRAVNFNDVTSSEAIKYIQFRLKRLGLDRQLIALGAKKGATVVIGDFVFEWEPDH